jgi:hypothetical protein
MLKVLVCIMALSVLSGHGSAMAQAAPVRLHIFTTVDPSGLVDEFSKERTTAVEEITKRMASQRGVEIVQSPAAAQVTVEITQAAYASPPNEQTPEIRARLRAGSYEVELVGESRLRWKQCWNELTADLKAWLKDNASVLAKRP